MTFNIHQSIFDRDGMPREKAARKYKEELIELFEQSPEGQILQNEGIEANWTFPVLDFGINYLSVTPPQMSPGNLREILFDLFPRKVSAEAGDAPEIIRELQLFWQFLQREFHLENAAACLKVLDKKAIHELEEEMSDPANFGIAKSFVMMGAASGFDMTTEEGIQSWMEAYNTGVAAGTGPRIPLPGERSTSARMVRTSLKRKMARDSRKKNRKKK